LGAVWGGISGLRGERAIFKGCKRGGEGSQFCRKLPIVLVDSLTKIVRGGLGLKGTRLES